MPDNNMVLDPEDGGFKSRKLLLVLFSMMLIFIASLIPSQFISANYPTLVGGIIALTTLYVGGNVASNMVIAKHAEASVPEPSKKKPPEPKEVTEAG